MSIWEKYEKLDTIAFRSDGNIYKAQNKKTKKYVAIKEIYNMESKDKFLKKVELMKILKNENSVLLKETFTSKDYFYIVMELCICDLEQCIQMREKGLLVNEIKEVLTQINHALKLILKEKIILRDLSPKNILISLNKIDKYLFKLSNYGSFNETNNSISTINTSLTMAPEVMNGEKDLSKCDLWSLGVIIYYMYFNEYPFNGNTEHILYNDIISKKKLKNINDKELNDLMNGLLKINISERLSWEEYFNHSFFQQSSFSFICKKHSHNIKYYCRNCKLNICQNCLKEHNSHKTVSLNYIGFNEREIKRIENLLKEIENNIYSLKHIKNEIHKFINQMKTTKENTLIYENDSKNNFKNYYIDVLGRINKQLKNKINLNAINFTENNIICVYDINEINKPIQVINCYEEAKKEDQSLKGLNNEEELKNNCEIYFNNMKLGFGYKCQFSNDEKNIIKIEVNQVLKNINYMFCGCSSLININLLNFNSYNITNMNGMFFECSSLTSLNLSNFNTENVNNMEYMFFGCSSLEFLNLCSFNTYNVTNMRGMFSNCSSLISLDLNSFNTNNVTDMSEMFSECSSLDSLDLSDFNTDSVENMGCMFLKCSSLNSLDLSNFNTDNVKDMGCMFSGCSSLISLNLSNFGNNNVNNMSGMFSECSSLTDLNLYNFNTNNVKNMSGMFCECTSLTSLDLSTFNTKNVTDMNEMFLNLNKSCKILSNDEKINKLII